MDPDEASEYVPVPEPPRAIPAATLVIFRRDPAGGPAQLLMVERSPALAFAGGAAVFPGGRIDEADRFLAASMDAGADDEAREELAARIAAVRETLEETGLAVGFTRPVAAPEAREARALLLREGTLASVLDRFGWTLAPAALVPWARWCPQHRHARVFDTRFYLADLGTGAVELAVDATENARLFWASADEALQLAEAGRIRVIFPTRRNLERLAQFADFAAARAHAESIAVRTISPVIEQRDGADWLRIPDDCGYPVTAQRLDRVERG
jgi:8-oxo-dGTP pyrophosphatase MutT (NUDIX family)